MPSTPRTFVGTVTVRVTDAVCGHCLDAVQVSVRQVPGVRSVTVDHLAGTVTVVAAQPVDMTTIHAAVSRAGHGTALLR